MNDQRVCTGNTSQKKKKENGSRKERESICEKSSLATVDVQVLPPSSEEKGKVKYKGLGRGG